MRLRGVKILSGRLFQYYQRNSFSYRSGSILLLVSRQVTHETMVGFVITKRVGSAVKRNYVRRRLRGLLGSLLSLGVLANRAYIFIPSPAASFSEFSTIRLDILSSLEKLSQLHSL